MVSFNEGGRRPAVVFFHTWASEAAQLGALAGFLGPEQPLFGIEPPSSADGPLPLCVDDWIAHDRPVFDTLPVEPPYFLAGFSFGGVLALEVARQLRAEGASVAWLGLIDTMRPKLNPKGFWPYLRYHFREVRDLSHNHARRVYLRRLATGGIHRTRVRIKVHSYRMLARLHIVQSRPPTFSEARGMSSEKRSIYRSYLGYHATPYDGPVALFSGTGSRGTARGDVNLRWSKYLTGGLDVTEIVGPHHELFTPPYISSVGAAIRDSLARAQGISSTRPNAVRLSR